MSKQFIQIGCDIINTNAIIRVEIDGEYISMWIRQIEAGEAEIVSGSYSKRLCWNAETKAGKALISWLRERTEVLYEA